MVPSGEDRSDSDLRPSIVRRTWVLALILVLVGAFHLLDVISRAIALVQGRTIAVSPHNIVFSPSFSVQIASLALLTLLIVSLVFAWRSAGRSIRFYLATAIAYWLLLVVNHVLRTRIEEYWNLGGALLFSMPVLVGATLVFLASRHRAGRSAR